MNFNTSELQNHRGAPSEQPTLPRATYPSPARYAFRARHTFRTKKYAQAMAHMQTKIYIPEPDTESQRGYTFSFPVTFRRGRVPWAPKELVRPRLFSWKMTVCKSRLRSCAPNRPWTIWLLSRLGMSLTTSTMSPDLPNREQYRSALTFRERE